MADMTKAAAAEPDPAARPKGLRLSKLAIFALLAASLAPWLQVLTMESGGKILGKLAAKNYLVLMAMDTGATLLFVAAIITSLVAIAQVSRRRVRGGALAVGGLWLAVGGMAGSIYGPTLSGQAEKMMEAMGGGTGHYAWQTTVTFLVTAVFCQIVLAFVRRGAPAAPQAEPTAVEQVISPKA